MKHTPFPALLVHWLCWTTVELGYTMVPSMVARPGENVTLQCVNSNEEPGHIAWFKQVNRSKPLCIASTYSSSPDNVKYHNGFQDWRLDMRYNNTLIFLTIREVDFSDSGLYFCGRMDLYISFTNLTFLEIKVSEDADNHGTKLCSDKDGTMSMFPLVLILGGVTAVFLLVILMLLLHISRGRDAHSTGSISQQQQDEQVQDSEELIYAPLKFTSKRKKGQRTRKMDLETQVVYAATR
ncbi:uncharacterized protein [Osmerus mordax]|uniref:uncharacterized protein n=1 Tax=Osmerus mordax TaxID=8014 RepID=UPI0035107D89